MSLQPSALPDAWKTKRFPSNWRWSTVSENLVIWSSAAPPPTEVVWVGSFFSLHFKSLQNPPRGGRATGYGPVSWSDVGVCGSGGDGGLRAAMHHSSANVLQYFSLPRPATAKRVDFCSLESVCACKRHRQWNITENREIQSCFQADWWTMLTGSVPFITFSWG